MVGLPSIKVPKESEDYEAGFKTHIDQTLEDQLMILYTYMMMKYEVRWPLARGLSDSLEGRQKKNMT